MKIIYALLLALALVGAVRGLRQTSLDAPLVQNDPENRCDACINVVNDAEDYLADAKTQDAVVDFMQSNICAMLPDDTARTCSQEARVLVAQAVASMEQYYTPKLVCSYMGLCDDALKTIASSLGITRQQLEAAAATTSTDNSDKHANCPFRKFLRGALDSLIADQETRDKIYKAITQALSPAASPTSATASFPGECPICKLVMETVEKRLRDPEMRKTIYTEAMEACSTLIDAEAVAKCCSDVDQLFASIDAMLDDFDAKRVCNVLQFCGDENMLRSSPVPAGMQRLQEIAGQLIAVGETKSHEDCEECEHVIQQASIILMDPETQQEIFEFVKQGCEAFDTYKDECEESVDEYGPMMVALMISYLQPQQLCARLGYCPSAASALPTF